jgi:hypothetical protein
MLDAGLAMMGVSCLHPDMFPALFVALWWMCNKGAVDPKSEHGIVHGFEWAKILAFLKNDGRFTLAGCVLLSYAALCV